MTNPSAPGTPERSGSAPPPVETSLSGVPKLRILAWLLVAVVTLLGVALYFLYGDRIAPVLVLRELEPAFAEARGVLVA